MSVQGVVAVPPVKLVIPSLSHEYVIAVLTEEGVIVFHAVENVVALASMQQNGGWIGSFNPKFREQATRKSCRWPRLWF